ncbi:MAG: hypothetical protein ACLQT6_15795 [Desulfomonilaceae bacterium]
MNRRTSYKKGAVKNGGKVWGKMGGVICKALKSLAVPTGFEPVSPP